MANQSAKKNQQAIRWKVKLLNYGLYPMLLWLLLTNLYFFFVNDSISFWHLIFCSLVILTTHWCIKQTKKCWQLQLPQEASEYYIDILALNGLVCVLDPFTHYVWHLYWLVVLYLGYLLAGWLWEYITPKYEEAEQTQGGKKKKQKKEKVKYLKK